MRTEAYARLRSLGAPRRKVAARALAHALGDLDGPVALFASLAHELDTSILDDALRTRGVARAFPRTVGAHLVFHFVPAWCAGRHLPRGDFRVPTPPNTWPRARLADCARVLVPGLLFSTGGARLGHGKGYYDRALRDLDPDRLTVIGFREQLTDTLPQDAHDVALTLRCLV